jgi:hypothetical protein
MYSINLSKFTLDEFAEILRSIDLLPGRRVLLDNLQETVSALKRTGIKTLSELQSLLKKKSEYPSLTKKLPVDENYLVILSREINSYESKPLPLTKLDIFPPEEIKVLTEIGIKTTKDLYSNSLTPADIKALSEKVSISKTKLKRALELSDLVRVTGVGPVFARMLHESGIKSITDFQKTASDEILNRYNETKGDLKITLGLKDIEYCKRFCEKLDIDIKW